MAIGYEFGKEEFTAWLRYTRFFVWSGRDSLHRDMMVQVRLEPDDTVLLSLSKKHTDLLQTYVSLDELYEGLKEVILKKKTAQHANGT